MSNNQTNQTKQSAGGGPAKRAREDNDNYVLVSADHPNKKKNETVRTLKDFKKKYQSTNSKVANMVLMEGGGDGNLYVAGDFESRREFFADYLTLLQGGSRLTLKEQIPAA